MGCWAIDKITELEAEVAKGGDLSTYSIPGLVIGGSAFSQAGSGMGATMAKNPMAQRAVAQAQAGGAAHPAATPGGIGSAGNTWLSKTLSDMMNK
jgi:hypothetical protein